MDHSHDHGTSQTGRGVLLSIFITVAFVIGEAAAGYSSNSLALLSDAGHTFADALALILVVWPLDRPTAVIGKARGS